MDELALNKTQRQAELYADLILKLWGERLGIIEEFIDARRGTRILFFGKAPATLEKLASIIAPLERIYRAERKFVAGFLRIKETLYIKLLEASSLSDNDCPDAATADRAREAAKSLLLLVDRYGMIIAAEQALLVIEARFIAEPTPQVTTAYIAAIESFARCVLLYEAELAAAKKHVEVISELVSSALSTSPNAQKLNPNDDIKRGLVSAVVRVSVSNGTGATVTGDIGHMDGRFLKLTGAIFVAVWATNILDYRTGAFTKLTGKLLSLLPRERQA